MVTIQSNAKLISTSGNGKTFDDLSSREKLNSFESKHPSV